MPQLSVYQIYKKLFRHYGPQNWWPGETPFEIMVGAVLTQNTSWTNVEKAIANLKREKMLRPDRLLTCSHKRLAALLVPVGYFNVKATRLKNFCHWYKQKGGLRKLAKEDTKLLRSELLSVNGIGPETADDMLLYAFDRPVFVIDAYTRRLFTRLGQIQEDVSYEQLRLWFEKKLNRVNDRLAVFNEYHALIVHHAKYVCRVRPLCETCCLQRNCDYI